MKILLRTIFDFIKSLLRTIFDFIKSLLRTIFDFIKSLFTKKSKQSENTTPNNQHKDVLEYFQNYIKWSIRPLETPIEKEPTKILITKIEGMELFERGTRTVEIKFINYRSPVPIITHFWGII